MGYFDTIRTIPEGKKLHRQLVKELHPDTGGNADDFRAMQQEWEELQLIEKHKPGWLQERLALIVAAQESRNPHRNRTSKPKGQQQPKPRKNQQDRFATAVRSVFREGGALVGEMIGNWLTDNKE